ncbi:hypothetical protein HNQ77_001860 [Silvibacterium bohemicum]|uniref:Uncharacterized protein n=1 Tax=Silvibacterium bohemicum TaxID=1577686 RepID=A0A841JY53_9BACT|nr:hypothetical protein [Silvibacterium bohemicum]
MMVIMATVMMAMYDYNHLSLGCYGCQAAK